MIGCRFWMPYRQQKDHRGENRGGYKVPVGKHPQVRERFARPKFPHDKRDERDDGNHRERANEIGVEPIFILSFVQNGLQRAQPNRQDEKAKGINASRFGVADVFRVKDELFDHPQGNQAARDVDVENPAPGIIFGEPAAHDRSHHGRQDNAHHISRHGRATLVGRKTFHQNRLRNRLQRAAARALHDGRENQEGKIWRPAARQRCRRENADARHQKPFPSEHGGKPRAGGQDDGVGNEIARLNPRRLRHRGGEIARNVFQRDADDRGVEHFDEGRQNHRERNDPRIDFRLVRIAIHKLRAIDCFSAG